ncbi:MAG: hypothetical protein ABH851_03905, partial [Methanobacteriota archaeon]
PNKQMQDKMQLMDGARLNVQRAMSHILDTFSGADGGGSFYRFIRFVWTLDQQAQAGDKSADILVDFVLKFSKLIEASKLK